MNKKEAETLLKYGAYDFFKEEREGRTEELSNAFCEADIDQILEKNAKVITIDSQGGSSFAKASFIAEISLEDLVCLPPSIILCDIYFHLLTKNTPFKVCLISFLLPISIHSLLNALCYNFCS